MLSPQDILLTKVIEGLYQNVSISQTHQHQLTALQHISPYTSMHAWIDMTQDKPVD